MKQIALVVMSLVLIGALAVGVSTAMAAKPGSPGADKPTNGSGKDVMDLSNGFPSGPHFNLNIHGKDPLKFTCESTNSGTGNSIFVPDNATSTITYVTSKKMKLTELWALDPCGMDGKATVQLPTHIDIDGELTEPDYWWVGARILGKPNNGSNQEPSHVALYPATVGTACADSTVSGTTTCEGTMMLGAISDGSVYLPENDGKFYRFDSNTTKGRGNSKGVEITPLLTWSGWVCNLNSFDLNNDGQLTDADVPPTATGTVNQWYSQGSIPGDACAYDAAWDDPDDPNDCQINHIEEWLMASADYYTGNFDPWDPMDAYYCIEYTEEWIFNIADIVWADQDVKFDGAKLLQIRFYPILPEQS
jgi:hypothetical protein